METSKYQWWFIHLPNASYIKKYQNKSTVEEYTQSVEIRIGSTWTWNQRKYHTVEDNSKTIMTYHMDSNVKAKWVTSPAGLEELIYYSTTMEDVSCYQNDEHSNEPPMNCYI